MQGVIVGLHAWHMPPPDRRQTSRPMLQLQFLPITNCLFLQHAGCHPLYCCVADDQEDEEAFLEAMTNSAAAPSQRMGVRVKSALQADWSPVLTLQAGRQQAGRLCN